MLFACAWLMPGLIRGQIVAPPAPPHVAPTISRTYSGDLNGNRINDDLEAAVARPRVSPSPATRQAAGSRMIAVELVFSEPVTQRQIDDFLALGGEITYLFKAISYGWNGRIPREQVALLPAVMGPSLVQVEPIRRLVAYMDLSSRTGRVRPIWQAGFAGNSRRLPRRPEHDHRIHRHRRGRHAHRSGRPMRLLARLHR